MHGQQPMQDRSGQNTQPQPPIGADLRQNEPMGPAKKRLIPQELLQASIPVHRSNEPQQQLNPHSMDVSLK